MLLAGRRRRALEQPDIMPLDRAQMRDERGGEFIAAGKAEKAGEAVERGAFGRQGVGLLVRHHLQAMLDAAQKIISRAEFVARGFIDPAVGGEPASMASVPRPRSAWWRPPAISCCVCTKNSISRMPPRPSFTLWPSTAISPWPR